MLCPAKKKLARRKRLAGVASCSARLQPGAFFAPRRNILRYLVKHVCRSEERRYTNISLNAGRKFPNGRSACGERILFTEAQLHVFFVTMQLGI